MYQKCVCFIFLVILAVLSCYGFRIDNLAMTDLTKKNFHTSPNAYYSNADKYVRADTVNRPHRIRHHRLWRTQAHHRYPKPPHIDAVVYPPPATKSISSTNDELVWPYKSSIESGESANVWPYGDVKPTSGQVELQRGPITHSEVLWPTRSSGEVFRPTHRVSSEANATQTRSGIFQPTQRGYSKVVWRVSSELSPSSEAKSAQTRSEVFQATRGASEVVWRVSSEVSPYGEAEASPTVFPDESLAQIPPTDFAPVQLAVSRSQRSPQRRSGRRRQRWSPVQNEDVFAKAYRAEFVILAEVESKHMNESNEFCDYYVKVIKDFKGNAVKDFWLLKKSYKGLLKANCSLVKEMKISKKYLLLLDKKLLLSDTPKRRVRQGMIKKLKRVCKKGFVPTKPLIVELSEFTPKPKRRNRILICKAKGFPPPKITWRRRNEVLQHSNSSYHILYRRRQSKLVIKKPDAGYLSQYECVAENVNGHAASKNITLLPPQHNKECPDNFKDVFCQNGGKCHVEISMGLFYCICPENYSGEKCEVKKPSNTSMYPQPDLYTCKLGLSTKYNC